MQNTFARMNNPLVKMSLSWTLMAFLSSDDQNHNFYPASDLFNYVYFILKSRHVSFVTSKMVKKYIFWKNYEQPFGQPFPFLDLVGVILR
jgi:hypothetical protein